MTRGNVIWTPEEDEFLLQIYTKQHNRKVRFQEISEKLPQHTSKSCRERWIFHIDPSINHKPLTRFEQNYILAQSSSSASPNWVGIAKRLSRKDSRRTPLQCKNFVNNRQRRIRSILGRLRKKYQKDPNRFSLGFILNHSEEDEEKRKDLKIN
ncbi:hypothetical protein G9A89_003486 [Geosiphon pyriformis]|nr:hypothetical protein G9A89_003486 [Geosiphon pyriformis]